MPRKPIDELEVFLLAQDVPTLAGLLLELSHEHAAVRNHLERLRLADRPSRLAASFRKSLNAWRRSTRFVPYAEAGAFGRELERWLAQIERELLPKDPAAALELAEAFIQSDGSLLERADDSNGAIGAALGAGCVLWLKAAARCEAPRDQWPDRLLRLAKDDGYGAREDLLQHANLLLDEAAMRQLVARFEEELRGVLAAARDRQESRLPLEAFTVSGPLTLLSRALRNPDVQVRAVQMYPPEPNPLQKAELAISSPLFNATTFRKQRSSRSGSLVPVTAVLPYLLDQEPPCHAPSSTRTTSIPPSAARSPATSRRSWTRSAVRCSATTCSSSGWR